MRTLLQPDGPRLAHAPCAPLTLSELAAALLRPLDVDAAEERIERLTGAHAVLFASCRGAMAAAVAELAPGGRVAISGYTCTAVPNAVLSGGAVPVYVDVDDRGLVPPEAWPEADVVIVQDTYGFVASIPQNRRVVRDAALATTGLAPQEGVAVSVTSFEQSKSLCAGQGGLALTFDPGLAARLRERRGSARSAGRGAAHAALTALQLVSSRLHYRGLRRLGARGSRAMAALSPNRAAGQSPAELGGGGVDPVLLGAPTGAVARLIAGQVERSGRLAEQRSEIVALYDRAAGVDRPPEPLSRYPMTVPSLERVDEEMLKVGWMLASRWFEAPLHPASSDPRSFGYDVPEDSNALRLSRSIINLPTHRLVTPDDARTLVAAALAAGAVPVGAGQAGAEASAAIH